MLERKTILPTKKQYKHYWAITSGKILEHNAHGQVPIRHLTIDSKVHNISLIHVRITTNTAHHNTILQRYKGNSPVAFQFAKNWQEISIKKKNNWQF